MPNLRKKSSFPVRAETSQLCCLHIDLSYSRIWLETGERSLSYKRSNWPKLTKIDDIFCILCIKYACQSKHILCLILNIFNPVLSPFLVFGGHRTKEIAQCEGQ